MEAVPFESARDKDVQRSRLREGRQRILEAAEKDFKSRESKKKKRREQEQWMLPSVNVRLLEHNKKDKKKVRGKKHKDKKCKKSKSRQDCEKSESTSDGDSESDVDEWVEKTSTLGPLPSSSGNLSESQEKLQRDSWMTSLPPSGYVPALSRDELRHRDGYESKATLLKKEEQRRRQTLNELGQHDRELNPYWKDGGTGLPTTDAQEKADGAPMPAVGDGGLRWLQRAYNRAKEQAAEENRTLEEVAAERWGSLEKLESMLREARQKSRGEERHHDSRERRSHAFRRPDDDDEDYRPKNRNDHKRTDQGPWHEDRNDRRSRSERRSSPSTAIGQTERSCPQACNSNQRWKKELVGSKPMVESKSSNCKQEKMAENDSKTTVQSECRVQPTTDVPTTPPALLTDKEMNDLGAKIIKAELLGNNEMATKLRSQLEAAKELKNKSQKDGQGVSGKEEVVIVRGKGSIASAATAGASGVRLASKKRVETHDADGKRARYYADDDRFSLKEMFEREKMGTAEDQNAMFARLIGKSGDKTTDDYDMDDMMIDRANRHVSDDKVDEQMRQRALQEHRKTSAAMDNCRLCFEGKDTPKHLMVAIGMKTYLSLPPVASLTAGHCLVVPMQHVSASTHLDEDVWSEIQVFRKGLTRMFEEQDRDVVFFESSLHLKRFPHMVLQCVPLPKDVGNLAPMYFKKAILESEMEWSNNKKLVDLSQKDVRRAIPKGLPYFSVDFGLQGGFAHVVEDEQLFPKNFAQEIIGGLLDLDPSAWRRPPRENFEVQRQKVLEFAEWWKPYDWTRRLDNHDG